MRLQRTADAPVRADPGARQRQALLGRRRRGREAAAPRARAGWPSTRSESRSPAATSGTSAACTRRGARPRSSTRKTPRADDEADERRRRGDRLEQPLSLNEQRLGDGGGRAARTRRPARARPGLRRGQAAADAARRTGSSSEIVGLDVSSARWRSRRATACSWIGCRRCRRARIKLLHGSLMYRDERLAGFDAAAVVEVIEHLDPPRLAAFERVLFEFARPATVVLTTPNREYNVKLRDAAGRAVPPPRPPLRVDARRVPGLGRAAWPQRLRLRGALPARRAGGRRRRRADADGRCSPVS